MDFLCKVSENNTKLLMKQGLVKELLKYLTCCEVPENIKSDDHEAAICEKTISENNATPQFINSNAKSKVGNKSGIPALYCSKIDIVDTLYGK